MTLEEWVDSHKWAKHLYADLMVNLNVMTDLSSADKERLMRLNMIMVRQAFIRMLDETNIDDNQQT